MQKRKKAFAFIVGFLAVLAAALWYARQTGTDFFKH